MRAEGWWHSGHGILGTSHAMRITSSLALGSMESIVIPAGKWNTEESISPESINIPLLTTSRQSDRCYSITLPGPFTASRLTYFGEGPLLLPLKKCDCSGIALVKFEGENCLF